MIAAPDAVPDDGLLEVGAIGERPEAPLPARARRRSSRASTSRRSRSRRGALLEVEIEADRPFSVYADGDPVAELPATLRVLPARADRDRPARRLAVIRARTPPARPSARSGPRPLRSGGLSRRSGRGGAPRCPAAMLLRMAPDAIARLGARLERRQRRSSAPPTARRPPPGCSPRRSRRPAAGRSTTAPVEHELGRCDGAARPGGHRGAVRGRRGMAAADGPRRSTRA